MIRPRCERWLAVWPTGFFNSRSGIDERPVVPNRETKSSGSENTFPEDLTNLDTMREEIAGMAADAAAWLGRKQLLARTVTTQGAVLRLYDDYAKPYRPTDLRLRHDRLQSSTIAGPDGRPDVDP